MSVALEHAHTFESLRPVMLARLVEVRTSLDHAFARISEALARQQLDAVLHHLQTYLATGDGQLHRNFLQTYLAVRVGEGTPPEAVIHALVSIGDVVTQVIRKELGAGRPDLLLAVTRVNAATTRLLLNLLAEELARRVAQRAQLSGGRPMSQLVVRAHGETNVGKVRDHNEDALIVDPKWGLYAVLDGMGGASAGDIASTKARDVIHEYVRARKLQLDPRRLLETAINAASAAVHGEAQVRRDRRGMGTTVVACLVVDDRRAVISHVGDSRAYLLRDGRLTQLTRDHTVVAELLAQGAIQPGEAERHAYRNVLSRNLGAKAEARIDTCEVELIAGDRILLCSDGLHGFTSTDAVGYVLGSDDPPEQVAKDLVEAALKGGGGDNVTVAVIEVGRAPIPRATQILRTTGSTTWWTRRPLFLATVRAAGLPASPICSVLSPDEAVDIVAGNLYEAIFHDLEKSTGVNVWTYAENLARGWFDQGGTWGPLRELLDMLQAGAQAVFADLRAANVEHVLVLETAVTRATIVAELAIGAVVAEQLRAVEGELVKLHAARQAAAERDAPSRAFTEQPTHPYLKAISVEPAPPDVVAALEQARRLALAAMPSGPTAALSRECVERAHRASLQPSGPTDAVLAARELYGVRTLEEAGLAPLLDALDQARAAHVEGLRQGGATLPTQVAALRRLTTAHQRLGHAIAGLVVEAAAPMSEKLRAATAGTAELRGQVGKNEVRIAELERKLTGPPAPASPGRQPSQRARPGKTIRGVAPGFTGDDDKEPQ